MTTASSLTEATMHESIKRFSMLESKFYQAWSAGELTADALGRYAHEYGAYISLVAEGWEGHGDTEIAEEEREHVELWREFARSLGTDIGEAQIPAVKKLVERARELYRSPATSLGALYAFEAQQPGTTTSKLEGLRTHYKGLAEGGEKYFEVHANDLEEPRLLMERINALSAADQKKAVDACEEICRLLREALDAIYDETAAPGASCVMN